MSMKERLSKSGWATGSVEKESQSVLARAVALHLGGKPKDALSELDAAVAISPTNQEILAARGHILCELEEWAEAAKNYTTLVDVAPRNSTAIYNLAVCLEKTRQWEQAGLRFDQAMKMDGKRVECYLGQGLCLLNEDKAEAALNNLEKYLEVRPEDETAQFGKAVAP